MLCLSGFELYSRWVPPRTHRQDDCGRAKNIWPEQTSNLGVTVSAIYHTVFTQSHLPPQEI